MYHFIYDSFLACVPHPWPALGWRRTARWELGSRWPPASPWGCSLWAALWAGSAGGDLAPTLRIGEGGFIGRGKDSQHKKQVEKDLFLCKTETARPPWERINKRSAKNRIPALRRKFHYLITYKFRLIRRPGQTLPTVKKYLSLFVCNFFLLSNISTLCNTNKFFFQHYKKSECIHAVRASYSYRDEKDPHSFNHMHACGVNIT